MTSALASAAWAPVRSEPSHRAELVSQWLCGERLQVRDERDAEGGWLYCEGPDGYTGWSPRGSLVTLSDVDADAWECSATAYSLGTPLRRVARGREPSGDTAVPNHLPWGARVCMHESGNLTLPSGVDAQAADASRLVPESALPRVFPPESASIVRTARQWLGAPYVWGGRTEWGVDCSGFVQAVFAVHGLRLPRDSSDQARECVSLEASPGSPSDERSSRERRTASFREGDLLFFAPEGKDVTHVAIAVGGYRSTHVIHASASGGCVTETGLGFVSGFPEPLDESVVACVRSAALFDPSGI